MTLHLTTGSRLDWWLQRGTGSSDPTADLIVNYVTPSARWFFGASVGGVLTTAARAFEAGNRFGYDAMVKTRITSLASRDAFLLLELNGRWQGHARESTVPIASSGGHLLYLSPGIQVLLRPNLVAEGGVQLPVLRNLAGTQLSPGAVAQFGIRYIIVP